MRAVVTGVAGFVGSAIAHALCARGDDVVGIDVLTDYYDPLIKRRNLAELEPLAGFSFLERDLVAAIDGGVDLNVDVIFHQAAQPGVRGSWGNQFSAYVENNITATQRLLEVAASLRRPPRIIYASSSSVYGRAPHYPTTEQDVPRPHSPYGVTKLAAEHLVSLYANNHGVPAVSLRYFTVYGPRQRPDMATHRLLEAAHNGKPFPLYGDGTQVRDFTYVGDVVEANLLAAEAEASPGAVFNVAGGSQTSLADLVRLVEEISGRSVPIERLDRVPGDVDVTGGETAEIHRVMGWSPRTALREGISRQLSYFLKAHVRRGLDDRSEKRACER